MAGKSGVSVAETQKSIRELYEAIRGRLERNKNPLLLPSNLQAYFHLFVGKVY